MMPASVVLPRPGRSGEQHVVERVAAVPRRLDEDLELLLGGALADEVVEPLRAQRDFDVALVGRSCGSPMRLAGSLIRRLFWPRACSSRSCEVGVGRGALERLFGLAQA